MAILKEIKVLVRRSIAERGTLRTAIRCAVAGPVYIWHRIQEMRYRPSAEFSDFDRMFGVDTDGATNNTTYLRDLEISQPELGACGTTTFRSSRTVSLSVVRSRDAPRRVYCSSISGVGKAGRCFWRRTFRSSGSSESIFRLSWWPSPATNWATVPESRAAVLRGRVCLRGLSRISDSALRRPSSSVSTPARNRF